MYVSASDGSKLRLDKPFAEGGEAEIWSIHGQPKMVAKMFHQPNQAKEEKLATMIGFPPMGGDKVAVAWPTELLYARGSFAGYLMPRVTESIPIFQIYNPARRKTLDDQFSSQYPWPYVLHYVAMNLAAAVKQVHEGGHVIGDLNESNVLVNRRALVTLVDVDSFQIHGPTYEKQRIWPLGPTQAQEIHRNVVGKAEFTAPELQGVDFKSVTRDHTHDNFALSALIFYLLMEGYHPYAGVLRDRQKSVGRVDLYCMKKGVYPYAANLTAAPPLRAPEYRWLHPEIRGAFKRAFVQGKNHPRRRPTADEWMTILQTTAPGLTACPQEREHIHYNHLAGCPMCEPDVVPQPLVDSQQLAGWIWHLRNVAVMFCRASWSWMTSRAKKGQTIATEAAKEMAQDVGRGGLVLTRFRPKLPSLGLGSPWLRERPRRSGFSRPKLDHKLRLWVRWGIRTFSGTVVGILIGIGLITSADIISWVIEPEAATGLLAIAVGLTTAAFQWPLLRAEGAPLAIIRAKWAALQWIGGTTAAYVVGTFVGGALFGLPTDWPNGYLDGELLVYWALMAGLLVGTTQSFWLRQHFVRGQDQRLWTFINAVGWVFLAYCMVYTRQGETLDGGYSAITPLIGHLFGFMGYILLTSVGFGWLASGRLRVDNHLYTHQQRSSGLSGWWGADWRRLSAFRLEKPAKVAGIRWVIMFALIGATMLAIEQALGWLFPTL